MGSDPHTERYNQPVMREHIAQCFEARKITPFQEGKRRLRRHHIINRKKVDVFCMCHLPWDKYDRKRGPLVQCIMCREWYHQNCLRIEQDIVNEPLAKFTCSICLDL